MRIRCVEEDITTLDSNFSVILDDASVEYSEQTPCCSVLQRVAVCCSVLQCVAVCCSVLQCVAVCCSVLKCVAV